MRRGYYRSRARAPSAGCLALLALPICTVMAGASALRNPVEATGLLLALALYLGVPVTALVWGVRHVRHARQEAAPTSSAPAPVPPAPTQAPAQASARTDARTARSKGEIVYWGKTRIGWRDDQGVVHLDHGGTGTPEQ
jgi:hypothetical protein